MRMLKKVIALVVAMAVMFTAFTMPVNAAEMTKFGYNPERNRVVPDKSYLPMDPLWVSPVGKSSTQPLILKGEHFGRENPVVVVLANNALIGVESTPRNSEFGLNRNTVFTFPMPGPSVQPSGGTYITWKDGYLYVGSVDGKFYIFRYNVSENKLVKISEVTLGGGKLVSAPLVTEYKDQLVVVCANGDGGEVVVITNFNKPVPDSFKFSFGSNVRVSGSPAPIDKAGFIIGSDGTAKVRGYYFDDILQQDSSGFLSLKGNNVRWEYKPSTEVPASYAISGDKVYFSDKDGRFYCLNKYNGGLVWRSTLYVGGSFINNSPGVYDGKVFFAMNKLMLFNKNIKSGRKLNPATFLMI